MPQLRHFSKGRVLGPPRGAPVDLAGPARSACWIGAWNVGLGLLRSRSSRLLSWWLSLVFWLFGYDAAWGQSHLGIMPWATGGALVPQPVKSDLRRLPGLDRLDGMESTAVEHAATAAGDQRQADLPTVVAPSVQWFPDGLIYRSYLGSVREPRFASVLNYEKDLGWLWDVSLGGRVGILRYGSGPDVWPDGWQLDMEGAAFPRLEPFGPSSPLLSTDFRFGIPITYGRGPFRFKTGYYHLSSHLGDEFLLANPAVERSNYSRDAFILAVSYYFGSPPFGDYDWRCYAEATWADWAPSRSDIAKPWEFLFGLEYSPPFEFERSTPFAAVNAHLREEANFGGHLSAHWGLQSRRGPSGALFRIGAEYVNGKSTQASFYREHENRIGFGLWYDY